MKISVVVHRDENLFPRRIEIRKGTRKKPSLTVEQTPSPVGDSYSIDFEGRKEALPSYPEIVSIVNQKRLDRIGTIEVVDELTLLKVLEELTLIKKIELVEHANVDVITTIRDVIHRPRSFIMNDSFDQGTVGWWVYGEVDIVTVDTHWSDKALRLLAGGGYVQQWFTIPLGVDWFEEIYIWWKCETTFTDVLKVRYYYSTGEPSYTEETFQVDSVAWVKQVLSPTAGKKIEALRFTNIAPHVVRIDQIVTVLANPI